MGIRQKPWRSRSFELIAATIGSVAFSVSMWVGCVSYYRGRSFNPRQAIISRLQSPDENSHGYLIAAIGTLVYALLTIPAARLFFLKLRRIHRPLARTGAGLIVIGLVATVALGCLAPFSSPFDPSHLVLAMFIFFTLTAGLAICFGLAAWPTRRLGLWLVVVVQFIALSMLVYMSFTPDFPPERSFVTSLAFLEWAICLVIGASILILTALVTNSEAVSAPSAAFHSSDSEEEIQVGEVRTP